MTDDARIVVIDRTGSDLDGQLVTLPARLATPTDAAGIEPLNVYHQESWALMGSAVVEVWEPPPHTYADGTSSLLKWPYEAKVPRLDRFVASTAALLEAFDKLPDPLQAAIADEPKDTP